MRTKSVIDSPSNPSASATPPNLLNNPPCHICYFNNAGKTPLPPSVQAAGLDAIQIEANPWTFPLHESIPNQIRQQFSKLIGACGETEIAICPSTGFALTLVAQNVSKWWSHHEGEGDNVEQQIVIVQDEMSSGVYPWQSLLESSGSTATTTTTLKIAPHPSQNGFPNWTESILDQISTCNNLKVVCVPQVHWSDGSYIDIRRIAHVCHEQKAILVIDATQSVGILELNVTALECPVIVAASVHKWLLGPHGTSLLYVPTCLLEQWDWQPLDQHERSRVVFQNAVYDATENNIDQDGYPTCFVQGAARLDSGGKKNPILLPMVLEGLKIVNSMHLQEAQEYLMGLTEYCILRAKEMKLGLGVQVGPRAGHILGLRPVGETMEWLTPERMVSIVKRLMDRKVYIAARAGAFRISPYVNSTYEEIDWLLESLAQALKEECDAACTYMK